MISVNSKRESSIELLKVLALIAIIICHTYTNFTLASDYTNEEKIFFDVTTFSNAEYFSFQIIITFGYLCDIIFFVCTSWFLCDKKRNNKGKIANMIINTFFLSVLFLLVYAILNFEISDGLVLSSFFPISNRVYWYITCYIIFYSIYPYLNILIDNISKKQHFSFCFVSFMLYYVYSFLLSYELFYINKLIAFIIIYFIVSYIKKYNYDFCESTKTNIIVFVATTFTFYLYRFVNFAITPINVDWHVLYNPFFLIMAISLLNIFRRIKFHSEIINTISSLTMFAYIVHSNPLLVNNTIIPLISKLLLVTGTNYIVIKILLFALLLAIISFAISFIYRALTNKLVRKISILLTDNFYNVINFFVKEEKCYEKD